jgi:trimeric autotransporter adhesin
MKIRAFVAVFFCLGVSSILAGCGGSSSGSGGTSGTGGGGGGSTTPTPTVTSISPTSATAGSGPLTLTVNGTNFLSSTTVEVGGVDDATTYVSATQLTATVEPAQLASGGMFSVIALNGTTTSGSGTTVNLQVNNPAPTIASLEPSTIFAGVTSPVVAVNGTGFVPTTVIQVGGSARTSTYISSTQVNVTLSASDVASAGSLSLTAVNASPGGGTSTASMLAVNNPAPNGLIKVSPTLAIAGTPTPTTVTVTGTNFIPASTVEVEPVPYSNGVGVAAFVGSPRATTYVSPTQLTFQLTAADQATSQEVQVEVVNPAPGGGSAQGGAILVLPQTPTPVITQVQPTQYSVQTTAGTITVTGTNLFPQINISAFSSEIFSTSSVLWNGTPLTTQGIGLSSLPPSASVQYITATVPASLLASAGTATITVTSPTATPAMSNAMTVTISNAPAPTLTSISPNSGLVNTEAFVTLTGTGFGQNSVANVNGTAIATEFESSTQLYANIPASALVSTGTVNLTVTTPAPGGGTSAALPFTVSNPPAPTLTSISPGGGPVNTAAEVSLFGTGFTSGSTVALNGVTIPSTYVSSTEITIDIPASGVALPGNLNITVTTPAPGGGTTTPLAFTAYLNITNNDIVYRAADGLLYASVPGSATSYGNSVIGIDPVTGNVERQIQVGSNPDKLALSTDGTQLFVGLDGAGAVAQVNLANGQVVNQFYLSNSSGIYSEPTTAQYMAPVPGLPNSVAVSSSQDVVTIYDSGVARAETSTSIGYNYYGALSFGASASTLYAANGSGDVMQLTVGATGFTAGSDLFIPQSSTQITSMQYDSGNLYLSNGEVLNTTNGTLAGTFYSTPTTAAIGPTVSDSSLGLAFVAYGSDLATSPAVLAFNESTFNATGNIPINGSSTDSYPYGFERIVRWGQDGVALNTSTQIFIFQSPVVKSLSSSPADLSATLTAPATATTGTALSYVATVQNAGPNAAQGATLALNLDPSFIVNSIMPSQGSCGTSNAFNCDLGNIASGSSATVTVSATPTTAGSYSGSAAVTSVSYDPTTTNNQATASTTVTGSFYAMAPVLTSISPALVQAGSGAFTLTVNGAGFNENSAVNVGSAAMPTSYVSATQLTANVTAAAIANYGWAPVTVTNASPGGGTSQLSPLTIYDLVNVTPNTILFDPFSQQIYATIPSTSTTVTGDSLVAINPSTGAVGTPVLVGSQPTVMAETSDGKYLYIGLTGSNSLAEFNLASQSLAATIPITYTQSGTTYSESATSLSAMPGTDSTVAMTFANTFNQFGIFDISGSTGAFRTNLSGYYDGQYPVFASATEIYSASGSDLYRYSVSSSGLTLIDSTYLEGFGASGVGFDLAGGLVYGGSGGIVNPSTTPPTQIALQALPEFYQQGISEYGAGAVADPSTQKDFVMEENLAGTEEYGLARFNTTTYLAESLLLMPAPASSVESTWTMLRWGQAGLALLSVPEEENNPPTAPQLLLLEGPFVTPQLLQTDTAATLASSSASSLTHGSGNTVLTLTGTNFLPGVAVTWNGSYRTTAIVSPTQVTVDIPASDLVNTGSGSLVATNPGATASSALTITIN